MENLINFLSALAQNESQPLSMVFDPEGSAITICMEGNERIPVAQIEGGHISRITYPTVPRLRYRVPVEAFDSFDTNRLFGKANNISAAIGHWNGEQ
jgi:hypothetical protein